MWHTFLSLNRLIELEIDLFYFKRKPTIIDFKFIIISVRHVEYTTLMYIVYHHPQNLINCYFHIKHTNNNDDDDDNESIRSMSC